MIQGLKAPVATIWLAFATAACAGSDPAVSERSEDRQVIPASMEKKVVGVRSANQRFRTLDEYLAYLERTQASIDGAWYRQIRPGVYELQRGNARRMVTEGEAPPPAEKLIFTRQELLEKFGFSE